MFVHLRTHEPSYTSGRPVGLHGCLWRSVLCFPCSGFAPALATSVVEFAHPGCTLKSLDNLVTRLTAVELADIRVAAGALADFGGSGLLLVSPWNRGPLGELDYASLALPRG